MASKPELTRATAEPPIEFLPQTLPDREARNPYLRYLLHVWMPLAVSLFVHVVLLAFLGLKTFEVMSRPATGVGEYAASLTESLADQMDEALRWSGDDVLNAPDDMTPAPNFDDLVNLPDLRNVNPRDLDFGSGGEGLGGLGSGDGALGVGDGALTLLGTGAGAGEAGTGGFGSGLGSGGSRIGQAGVWDLSIRANRVAYVIDFSGSILFSAAELKRELKRSIGRLRATQSFDVILFFSTGAGVDERFRTESFRPKLEPATEANRKAFFEWIDRHAPQGETRPLEAMKRALELAPEAVFFFSDGYFEDSVVTEINLANRRANARIYCLVFDEAYLDDTSGLPPQPKEGALRLKRIAEANGGKLKIVTGRDLAR